MNQDFTRGELEQICSVSDVPEPADLAVVLGCTEPGPDPHFALRNRTMVAVDLYRRGFFRHILFTGGSPVDVPRQTELDCEAFRMKRIFEAHISVDVQPSVQVTLETQASNTAENAKRTLELLQKDRNGLLASLKTLLLVSCDYHMRRARHEFATCFPGVRILCCPFVNDPAYRHVKAVRELPRLRRLGLIPIQRVPEQQS